MENENYININLSNERFISIFNNRIDNESPNYIINYIYNYNNFIQFRHFTFHEEILMPVFVEQEFVIPDDAVCGISFELPNCRTSCGHYFCRAEITRWLEDRKNVCKKMTCPTCREEITQVFVIKNI